MSKRKWERPCGLCDGKSKGPCILCGWSMPGTEFEKKKIEQTKVTGIRERAAFLDAMNMGLLKVGATAISGNIDSETPSDPEANKLLMAEIEEHRKWAMELYERHTKQGESLKEIAKAENLNPGLARRIIENMRHELIRKNQKTYEPIITPKARERSFKDRILVLIEKLFSYKTTVRSEREYLIIGAVVWKRNFGPWTMHQYCEQIRIDFETAFIYELDTNDNTLKSSNLQKELK